jgi:hypothetical protein
MADVISDYQKWKQQGEHLRTEAKQAMETRFRELLSEAVSIAEEYRADFGGPLKPPAPVTAFRFRASSRAKAKRPGKPPAGKPPAAKLPAAKSPAAKPAEAVRLEVKEAKPDPRLAGLQKQLAAAKKKLEEAKAAGGPTRKLDDRVYEIEDALRLAGQPV